MTKLIYGRTIKAGRKAREAPVAPEWQPRTDRLIKQDLAALSSQWEGTADQRREWARLKDELNTNRLLAKRL
jgi:hypothetical protein